MLARDREVAVLFRWPIKFKLLLCVGLLVVIVGVLAINSLRGLYAYRELAKTISWRADEMPAADDLSSRIGQAQEMLLEFKRTRETQFVPRDDTEPVSNSAFHHKLGLSKIPLGQYRDQLDQALPN